MLIFAKSALDKQQLDCKMEIGCDGLEIQLLTELVDGKLGNYFNAEDAINLDRFKHYPVSVVHVPLLSHYGMEDVNIESFCDEDFKMLDQVFYIANFFGLMQNKTVLVVCHSETDKQNMMLVSDTWKQVKTAIGSLLLKYPYTELAIENVTPLRRVGSGNMHLCNNFHFDNVEMAKELRAEFSTDRIGTCLDVCHAMIARKYMLALFKELGEEPENYSLDAYFEANKDYIKLIHLADFKGNGYGPGKHGTAFDENSKEKLRWIMSLYDKYNYQCPITLEVGETNYLISDNYAVTRNVLRSVLSESEFKGGSFQQTFSAYCKKYNIQNAKEELSRLEELFHTKDKAELERAITYQFM